MARCKEWYNKTKAVINKGDIVMRSDFLARESSSRVEILSWKAIKAELQQVNSMLAQAIEDINLKEEVKFYKITYQYGTEIFNNGVLQIPYKGTMVSIHDNSLPAEYKKNLGYEPFPFGLVLKNSITNIINFPDRSVPVTVFKPGQLFGLWELFDNRSSLLSKQQWNIYSGAVPIFSTTKLSNHKKYQIIKKKYNLKTKMPDTSNEQFLLFKELINHPSVECNWSSSVLFFCKEFRDQITEKNLWQEVQNFFLKYAWKQSLIWRFDSMHRIVWDIFFESLIKNNFKNFESQMSILKHITKVSYGALPFFIFDDQKQAAAPTDIIKEILIDEYKTEFNPSIVLPWHLTKDDCCSGYYSILYPTLIGKMSVNKTEKTSIEIARNIFDLYTFVNEKHNKDGVYPFLEKTRLLFFHPKHDESQKLLLASELPKYDSSIVKLPKKYGKSTLPFNENGTFYNGLIKISIGHN